MFQIWVDMIENYDGFRHEPVPQPRQCRQPSPAKMIDEVEVRFQQFCIIKFFDSHW